MARRLLVTGVYQPQALIDCGQEDRVEMASVKAEDRVDPGLLQDPDEEHTTVEHRIPLYSWRLERGLG